MDEGRICPVGLRWPPEDSPLHQTQTLVFVSMALAVLISSNFPFEKSLLTHPREGVCLYLVKATLQGRMSCPSGVTESWDQGGGWDTEDRWAIPCHLSWLLLSTDAWIPVATACCTFLLGPGGLGSPFLQSKDSRKPTYDSLLGPCRTAPHSPVTPRTETGPRRCPPRSP